MRLTRMRDRFTNNASAGRINFSSRSKQIEITLVLVTYQKLPIKVILYFDRSQQGAACHTDEENTGTTDEREYLES